MQLASSAKINLTRWRTSSFELCNNIVTITQFIQASNLHVLIFGGTGTANTKSTQQS